MISDTRNRAVSSAVLVVFIFSIIFFTGIMPEKVYAATSAFSIIEAENYSSQNGANIQIVDVNPSGKGLGYITKGDVVAYYNIDFGYSGVVALRARVATQYNNINIEIRSGSPNGNLLGTLSVSSTGDFNNYSEFLCSVNYISGVQNIYLIFSGPVNIDWFSFIPSSSGNQTPTPTVGYSSSGSFKVEFFNSNRSSMNNSIEAKFKVKNTGSSTLNLSAVKLRYYYTSDDTGTQKAYCDYSSVQQSNVSLNCIKLEKYCNNADYYLEVGFYGGNLDPGTEAIIHVRITGQNQSGLSYNQTNDYSFNPSAGDYTSWYYVTGYINNTLVWGIEPTLSNSTPTPKASSTPNATATNSNQSGTYNRIEAEDYTHISGNEIKEIRIPDGYGLGYIEDGNYAAYYNVDFGNRPSLFELRMATANSTSIEIRVGSQNGTLIGSLTVPSTGSWDTFEVIRGSISNSINGVNNLYLVFKGPVNIDWFAIIGNSRTPTPTPVPTATPATVRNPFVEIQAETYDFTNAQYIQTFGISGGGYAIGYLSAGDYIAFNNVNFGSGINTFKARIATENATKLEIRVGGANGPLLAEVPIPSTGSWENYQEISFTFTNGNIVSNNQTLYFVFNGPINFDWYVFTPNAYYAPIDGFSRIEAENYTGASDSNIQKINGVICYIQSGDYVVFNNVNFNTTAKSFKAYVANASNSTTNIEIRAGSSTGTLLGTLSVPSTSSWDEFYELACNINNINGNQNIYLVFTGPVNVDWFTFSQNAVVPTATPTPTPTPTPTATPTPTPTATPTPSSSISPTAVPTSTPVLPSPTASIIEQPNVDLSRFAPQRAELASVQTLFYIQEGELTLNGMGTLKGEKEVVILVDNAYSSSHVSTDIITPMDYAIFSYTNIRGVGDKAKIVGNVHANGRLESYIADLKVAGVCSASTLTLGYGTKFEGSTAVIDTPIPMPVFHNNIIAEIEDEVYKFYPSEFPDSTDRDFPNQPGFHIRYEHGSNTFVITGSGTFNLESSMYFDGNLRISVPHIINTNSNFLVAEGSIILEGHNVNNEELDENSINNTTNVLNVYSIHGRISVTTQNSKIYGVLYAAGEPDPTGKYTNDIGVVVIQGINTDVYGSIVAGSDVRVEGSSSTFYYTPSIASKIEKKYIQTDTLTTSKSVAQQVIDLFIGTNTKVYALHYSDKAYVDMETFKFFDLSPEVNEIGALREHINSFPENESGFSNMGDALRRGKEILTHPTKSSPDAAKYIIVLTANAPNKWTSNIDLATGEAVNIEGDGTIDADGNALNYAINMAASIADTNIKTIFVNNSPKDISANIEKIAVASGAPAVNGDKHYYTSVSMISFSPLVEYVLTDPPKKAVLKDVTYVEIFPEGIQLTEIPSGARIDIVEGTKREKLTIDNLNVKLTYDGTNYIIDPFTIIVKIRPMILGDILFPGSDSKIIYKIEYIDNDGNVKTAEFEKYFNELTLNVYMTLDIS